MLSFFCCTNTKPASINTKKDKSIKTDIEDKIYTKYLGIILDNNLEGVKHSQFSQKSKVHHVLHKVFQINSKDHSDQKFYYVIVQATLQYGIIGWGSPAHCYIKHLKIRQKRNYSKNSQYPTSSLLNKAKLLDIRQIYCKHVHLQNHKKLEYYHNANTTQNLKARFIYQKCSSPKR